MRQRTCTKIYGLIERYAEGKPCGNSFIAKGYECKIRVRSIKDFSQKDLSNFTESLEPYLEEGSPAYGTDSNAIKKMGSNSALYLSVMATHKMPGTKTLFSTDDSKNITGGVSYSLKDDIGKIHFLATHPENLKSENRSKNKGIGSSLLKKSLEDLKKYGAKQVVLEPSPEAVDFYLKMGFEPFDNDTMVYRFDKVKLSEELDNYGVLAIDSTGRKYVKKYKRGV